MKRLSLLGVVLSLSLAFSACGAGGGSDSGGDGPIRVGAAVSLTGAYAQGGTAMLNGYKFWAKEVNAAGGLNGRKVKLITYDDHSDAEDATAVARRLIDKDHVSVILGPFSSVSTAAMAVVAEQSHVPLLATLASDEGVWDQRRLTWAFMAFASAANDETGFIDIAHDQGAKKIALITQETGAYVLASDRGEALAQKYGMTAKRYNYPAGTKDFGSILEKVSAFDPDAIQMESDEGDGRVISQQMIERGMNVDGYQYIGCADPQQTLPALKKDAEGIICRTTWMAKQDSKGNAAFVKGYEAKYGAPSYYSATAYAGGQVVAAAIKAVGNDSQKMRDFFATKEVPTVQGTYKVDEKGKQEGYEFVMLQYRGGKEVIVAPPDLATDKVVWPKPTW